MARKSNYSSEQLSPLTSLESSGPPVPTDLPIPTDDGAASHLESSSFPPIYLPSTAGNTVQPSILSGLQILFCYPRTGAPGENIPAEWNAIPGARGCTPQACAFRDLSKDFLAAGVSHIFGVSAQDTEYQREVKERVHLPFQLLSDEHGDLCKAMKLPVFEWEGKQLMKRLTMAVEDGTVVKVWYPVFPPDKNAGEVLQWLEGRKGSTEHAS